MCSGNAAALQSVSVFTKKIACRFNATIWCLLTGDFYCTPIPQIVSIWRTALHIYILDYKWFEK